MNEPINEQAVTVNVNVKNLNESLEKAEQLIAALSSAKTLLEELTELVDKLQIDVQV